MDIKVETTDEQRKDIEDQLNRYENGLTYLYKKYLKDKKELEERIESYKEFWRTNEMPIYDWRTKRVFDRNRLHETSSIYKGFGTVNTTTLKEMSGWVCSKCLQPRDIKYIVTGHDHTDYSYDVCDCPDVQGNTPCDELT